MSDTTTGTEEPKGERLQKVMASHGVASRRQSEEMIKAGRVSIDGNVTTTLGVKVFPGQTVAVDGKQIRREEKRYIMLNKPSGYITTTSDERGRDTVMKLVDVPERVVPVGRLDRPTEGLLLLTNDGTLAYHVMHPQFEIEKEYEALLDGFPPPEVLNRIRKGVTVDGILTVPTQVRPLRLTDEGTVVRIVIHEGRNRIVRRMFESVGYPVRKLKRTRIGPLQLGNVKRGEWRELTPGELQQIEEAVHVRRPDENHSSASKRRPKSR